jgi:hypothetical protein
MAEHGTYARYNTGKCRCVPCKAANRRKQQELVIKLHQKPEDLIPHGLNGYRNYGHRCLVCKEANAAACGVNMDKWRAKYLKE